ncbi:syntaxin-18 [Eurytemora carolleeae]|uniref:syntaxin-18 n=1 Tax=Eurytemora carolleeae TaxID=1294199 RepID=UPI000C75AB96|nr:syntaxin-18 [Eurytemora carolleeae]|eukprot:XP_023323407.1 syntaxin-18-like [Eurytemora affinis]
MMELNSLWKDILQELREKGEVISEAKDKNRILRNQENQLTRQSASIVKSIGQLKQLLMESRAVYMLGGGAGGMSEVEMDQLDVSADDICLKCTELIKAFKAATAKHKMSNSGQEHFGMVGVGLEGYLKKVISIHSEMRAVRLKKQIQLNNLSKLETNSRESRLHEIPRRRQSEIGLQEKAVTAAALAKSTAWESSDEEEELR